MQEQPMTELALAGLKFPEGPRWHDGAWWLSDQLGDRILRVEPDGAFDVVCELDAPSGLGFLADGSLVAARMNDPSLVRVGGHAAQEVVDLRSEAGNLNDMFVGPTGLAYVDAYGSHDDPRTQRILLVDLADGGAPVEAAGPLEYPNGLAVTPDGRTLIVSETRAARLRAFDVGADGSLTNGRTWAALPPGTHPDGLCLDENGDVWVASYLSGEFLLVRAGGEVLRRLVFPGRWAMACSLGGADGRTLLLCTSECSVERYFARDALGHLETVTVDVPGVGRP